MGLGELYDIITELEISFENKPTRDKYLKLIKLMKEANILSMKLHNQKVYKEYDTEYPSYLQ